MAESKKKKSRGKIVTERTGQSQPPLSIGRESDSGRGLSWKHIVIIAFVCIAVYSNTLFMDFVWDDIPQIKENRQIKSLENIPSLFTSQVWAGVRGEHRTPYYRPMFTLSFAVDYFFWGEKPFGYHLTNILLHALVSVLVYLMAIKILKANLAALLAGLIFAVHPVHADAVAWISARNEPLSALFMFTSFYLYILWKEQGKLFYIGASLAIFFLALLSKEMAITLPAIILLYEICTGKESLKKKLQWPIIYGLVTIPYFVLRVVILEKLTWGGIVNPLSHRIYTGTGLITEYIRLLILPINLKLYYDIPIKKIFFQQEVIIPFLVLGIILSGVILSLRYDKRLFFGLLWIFISLLPVSGLPTLIYPAPMAERYLYIPSAGFSMAIGIVFQRLISNATSGAKEHENDRGRRNDSERKTRNDIFRAKMIWLLGIIIISILFVQTFQRNYAYRDHYSFVKQRVREAPNYAVGHNTLAGEHLKRGYIQEALNEINIALHLRPNYSDAYINLGAVYNVMERYGDAIREIQRGLKLRTLNFGRAFYNLGAAYKGLGRIGEAIDAFKTALKHDPDLIEAYNYLGHIYIEQGRFEDALREFETELRLNNEMKLDRDAAAESHYNIGYIYYNLKRFDEAVREFQNALKLRHNYPDAYNSLGIIYIEQKKIDQAIVQFRNALSISPDNKYFKENLDKAYAMHNEGVKGSRVQGFK